VVFGAASEAFSQKNINCSAESDASAPWSRPRASIYVRGHVLHRRPYEGEIAPERVCWPA
jgi:hypothetical protein